MAEGNGCYSDHFWTQLDNNWRRRSIRTGGSDTVSPGLDEFRPVNVPVVVARKTAENYTTDRHQDRTNGQTDKHPTAVPRQHPGSAQDKWRIRTLLARRAFLRLHRGDQSFGRHVVRHQLHICSWEHRPDHRFSDVNAL